MTKEQAQLVLDKLSKVLPGGRLIRADPPGWRLSWDRGLNDGEQALVDGAVSLVVGRRR